MYSDFLVMVVFSIVILNLPAMLSAILLRLPHLWGSGTQGK